jgi:hypothetical protein
LYLEKSTNHEALLYAVSALSRTSMLLRSKCSQHAVLKYPQFILLP